MHGIPIYGPEGRLVSPQHNRQEWKTIRGPCVGSSDLPALLGHDEYQGPWQIWDRITLGIWDDSDNADIRRGNRQEPNAIQRFTEEFGLQTESAGMIHHPEDKRIVSDLDAIVCRPLALDLWPEIIRDNPLWDHVRMNCQGDGALEAKVPRTARYFQYRDEGMLKAHAIQMQHHLEVSGLEWGVLTFYNPEYDQSIAFPVVREPKIGEWIREQIPAWYRRYVDTRERPMRPIPPPPVWPATPPGIAVVREDPEWMNQAVLLRLRYYELLEAQEAYDDTEKALLALTGDGEEDCHITGGGIVVKKWQPAARRNWDRKRFEAKLKLAQMEGDIDAVMALDPSAEDYYYKNEQKRKVEVKVVGPNPAET
jgi:hypothetical protein